MPDSQSVGIKNFDWINVCLAFEVQTFLRGLLLVEDKLSMHFSLENRLPFLDNEIIDLALKIPIDRKIARNQESGKLILREALQQILPGNVRSKPKKGFSGPDALWMRSTNKSEMLHRFTNPKNIIFNFLDFSTVQLLIMEHMNGKANHRLFLWSLLHLEYFFGSQM
jgi:asparagine synthase (glutamine-hydrolysing)